MLREAQSLRSKCYYYVLVGNGSFAEKVIANWSAAELHGATSESKPPAKSKSKRSEQRRKSTNEIMIKKFGLTAFGGRRSFPVEKISNDDREKTYSGSVSDDRTHEDSVEDTVSSYLEHISLQLTDHPSYTFDEDKVSPTSVRDTTMAQLDSELMSYNRNKQKTAALTETSYDQTINLSRCVPVHSSPIEHWSSFIGEGVQKPDPPICPPYSYALYNPQTNAMLDPTVNASLYPSNNNVLAEHPGIYDNCPIETEESCSGSRNLTSAALPEMGSIGSDICSKRFSGHGCINPRVNRQNSLSMLENHEIVTVMENDNPVNVESPAVISDLCEMYEEPDRNDRTQMSGDSHQSSLR